MATSNDTSPKKAASPGASPQKVAETVKDEPEKVTKTELSDQFTEIKDAGNAEYKRKMWVDAIAKFGEGINLYEKNRTLCEGSKDLKTKITQLYTNRALSWHQLDKQDEVLKDCSHVLKFLDESNAKALFRRSHSYKVKGRYYEAIKDLE